MIHSPGHCSSASYRHGCGKTSGCAEVRQRRMHDRTSRFQISGVLKTPEISPRAKKIDRPNDARHLSASLWILTSQTRKHRRTGNNNYPRFLVTFLFDNSARICNRRKS